MIPVLILKDVLLVNVRLRIYTHSNRHPKQIYNYIHTNVATFHSEATQTYTCITW